MPCADFIYYFITVHQRIARLTEYMHYDGFHRNYINERVLGTDCKVEMFQEHKFIHQFIHFSAYLYRACINDKIRLSQHSSAIDQGGSCNESTDIKLDNLQANKHFAVRLHSCSNFCLEKCMKQRGKPQAEQKVQMTTAASKYICALKDNCCLGELFAW